jgi:hypothetical protein
MNKQKIFTDFEYDSGIDYLPPHHIAEVRCKGIRRRGGTICF